MAQKSPKSPLLRWYDPALMGLFIPPLTATTRLWLRTCRLVRVEGSDRERALYHESGGRIVYVTWHQRVAFFIRVFTKTNLCVMVSQSRDGEYGVSAAHRLGLSTVRGSSTRGGPAALRGLIEKVKEGWCGGILADGPRGPARIAKMGAVALARETGAPIVPLAWGADRCWMLDSWDRSLFPKPFARVMLSYGEPISVPPDADEDALEDYRRGLERALNRLTARCDHHFGEERPWRRAQGGLPEVGPLPPEARNSSTRQEKRDITA